MTTDLNRIKETSKHPSMTITSAFVRCKILSKYLKFISKNLRNEAIQGNMPKLMEIADKLKTIERDIVDIMLDAEKHGAEFPEKE